MPRPITPPQRSTGMHRRVLLSSAAAQLATFAGASLVPHAALAQTAYPSKPITLIVPYPPGGTTDAQIRAVAAGAAKELGQPILVVNRPGVSGTMAPVEMARRSPPDGYTLSMLPSSLLRLPHMMKNADWDPIEDFTYIIGLTNYAFGIVVPTNARWQSLQALLDEAKARPNHISFATSGYGGTAHVNMTKLLKTAGAQMNFVAYKGAELITAVIGGHVDVMVEAGWGAYVNSGKMRLLAVMTEQRAKNYPNVPTAAELGFDVSTGTMFGIGGPKGMDATVVEKLYRAFRKAADEPAFQRILDLENQPFTPMASAEYKRKAAEQFKSDGLALKKLGIELP